MKVLFCTPAKGGVITMDYFECAGRTLQEISGVQFHHSIKDHDLCIEQCRNICADEAIKGGYDKLLMVDSDQLWEPEDVLKLLKSDKKIVGGTYPYKELPIKLVFTVMSLAHVPNHMGQGKFEEIEVKYLPTGFMCIDVEVLKAMSEKAKGYLHYDRKTDKSFVVKHLFRTGPKDEKTYYLTEDFGFCDFARECGFNVYLNTTVVVDHVGNYRFSIRERK